MFDDNNNYTTPSTRTHIIRRISHPTVGTRPSLLHSAFKSYELYSFFLYYILRVPGVCVCVYVCVCVPVWEFFFIFSLSRFVCFFFSSTPSSLLHRSHTMNSLVLITSFIFLNFFQKPWNYSSRANTFFS